ncbi:MAG: MerR family DNA-binding transcriptional regulator [Phreatobacter sp.]
MIAIGVLSRRAGVNIETIRYYERIGLMPKPDRTESGRRLYGAPDVQRLPFIRHAVPRSIVRAHGGEVSLADATSGGSLSR